jgi:hypothetical protein
LPTWSPAGSYTTRPARRARKILVGAPLTDRQATGANPCRAPLRAPTGRERRRRQCLRDRAARRGRPDRGLRLGTADGGKRCSGSGHRLLAQCAGHRRAGAGRRRLAPGGGGRDVGPRDRPGHRGRGCARSPLRHLGQQPEADLGRVGHRLGVHPGRLGGPDRADAWPPGEPGGPRRSGRVLRRRRGRVGRRREHLAPSPRWRRARARRWRLRRGVHLPGRQRASVPQHDDVHDAVLRHVRTAAAPGRCARGAAADGLLRTDVGWHRSRDRGGSAARPLGVQPPAGGGERDGRLPRPLLEVPGRPCWLPSSWARRHRSGSTSAWSSCSPVWRSSSPTPPRALLRRHWSDETTRWSSRSRSPGRRVG